jgi:hypothetical protein
VSVSFVLLAYVEAFVLLGGAYLAARPVPQARMGAVEGEAPLRDAPVSEARGEGSGQPG